MKFPKNLLCDKFGSCESLWLSARGILSGGTGVHMDSPLDINSHSSSRFLAPGSRHEAPIIAIDSPPNTGWVCAWLTMTDASTLVMFRPAWWNGNSGTGSPIPNMMRVCELVPVLDSVML